VLVNAIVELLALNVSPVTVVKSTEAVAELIVHVPLPILNVRVPVPVTLKVLDKVTLLLLAEKSSVPVNAPKVKL